MHRNVSHMMDLGSGTVRVSGIPPGGTTEELEEFFEDERNGGAIEMVCLLAKERVLEVTFENIEDAEKVTRKQSFYFRGCHLKAETKHYAQSFYDARTALEREVTYKTTVNQVKNPSRPHQQSFAETVHEPRIKSMDNIKIVESVPHESRDAHVVEVVGATERRKEEILILYFESPRNNGGQIEDIFFNSSRKTFWIRFSDSTVARNFVGRDFEVDNMLLHVKWPDTEVVVGGAVDEQRNKVLVYGIEDPNKVEHVLLFFESPRNHGGPIDEIKFIEEESCFLIVFRDESVAENFIGHTFSIAGYTALVCCYSENIERYARTYREPDWTSRSLGWQEKVIPDQSHGTGHTSKANPVLGALATYQPSSRKSILMDSNLRENEDIQLMQKIDCTMRVMLTGESHEIKRETLRRYVENKGRSGGGPVRQLEQLDKDIFEVCFIDQTDAQTFLSQTHVIQGCKLQVYPLTSSEFVRSDLVLTELEPRKLLLEWMAKCEVKVTHDDLQLYLTDVFENRADVAVSFVPKINTALVELSNNWDSETLARRFKTTPFVRDGSIRVRVTPLRKPTCIVLPKLEVDKMTLQYYFESSKRGGDAGCEVDVTSEMTVVRCPNNEVAQRLVSKTHEFAGKEYNAELIYEQLGIIPPAFNRKHPFIEPSAIVIENLGEKSKFFTFEAGIGYTNVFLENYARLDTTYKQQGAVKVSCTLKKTVKDYAVICQQWQQKVENVIWDIATTVDVCGLPALEKTWDSLKKTFLPELRQDMTVGKIVLDEVRKLVEIVGLKDEVDSVRKKLENSFERIVKDLESIEEEVEFDPLMLECLKINGFLEKVKALPNVKIRHGQKSNSLVIVGPGADVYTASRQVRKEKDSLHQDEVDLCSNIAELMKKQHFLEEFISKHSLNNMLIKPIGNHKVALVGMKHQIDKAKQAVNTGISEFKVYFREESKPLIGQTEWKNMIAKQQGTFMFDFQKLDRCLEIASLTEDSDKIRKTFIKFFEENTVWEERIALSEGKMHILCSQFVNELKLIPLTFGSNRASITPSDNPKQKGLIIRGSQSDLAMMRWRVDEIVQKWKVHHETITGSGAKALGQETGRYFLIALEQDCKRINVCISKSSESESEYEIKTKGIHLSVKTQCLALYDADVLVNSANEDLLHSGALSKVLTEAGGPIVNSDSLFSVQVFGKIKSGEVRATSGGLLPCRVLYHVVGPKFGHNKTGVEPEKELFTVISNCLEKAAKAGFSSIAFPLISAGSSGGPIQVITKVMAKAVAEFINKDRNQGHIKEITVLDVDGAKTKEVAKAFQLQFGGSTVKSTPTTQNQEINVATPDNKKILQSLDSIANQKVDVIISTVSRFGDLYGGPVSTSIMKCMSEADQKAIQDQVKKQMPVKDGDFISTGGGGKWKFIYHALLPRWKDGEAKAESCLKGLVTKALESASKLKMKSIAIPALGTGGLKFPHDVVAKTMYTAAKTFLEKNKKSSLETVVFIVYAQDESSVQAFSKVFSMDDAAVQGKVVIGKICSFEVVQGDITKEKTDCIVNLTNSKLDFNTTGKVAKAIVKAAGDTVIQECAKKGGVGKNGTAVTGAGNLNCQKICHLDVAHDKWNHKENIKSCLEEADKHAMKSISFPALGTGALRKDPKDMARIMMEAIAEFTTKKEPKYLREIRVCIFDEEFLDSYHQEMQRVVSEGKTATGWRKKVKSLLGQKVPSSVPKETPVTPASINHEVKLCITYTDEKDKDVALKKIQEFCKILESTVILGGSKQVDQADIIKRLDDFQIYELRDNADKHCVSIKIDKEKGTIELKGHDRDVNEVILVINNVLFHQKGELHEKGEAELMAKFVQWQFENNGEFEAYPQDINVDIEKAYRAKEDKVSWNEERGGKPKKFTVYFKDKVEVDESGKKTKIYRNDLSDAAIKLPSTWEPMGNEPYKLVTLPPDSPEYQKVKKALNETVNDVTIIKIERVQNPSLYVRYIAHKRNMKKPNERKLWHGTSAEVMDNILTNGFNRNYLGTATDYGYYGKGVYFASKASLSVHYAKMDPKKGLSYVLFNDVLVGEYTQGKPGLLEPPLKNENDSKIRYDSCVDDPKNISETVIFHDTQCYPAYCITYKK